MDNNQKALSHFGVLGMRWGVRKSPAASGKRSLTRAEQKMIKEPKEEHM